MISNHQFNLLVFLKNQEAKVTQREIAKGLDLSLGKVNHLVTEAERLGWINSDYSLTEKGIAELEPYRVQNAIIMAAGMSTRFAPLSYESPKGLLVVKGERLIERQICQLREAGIDKITVIVGYMKEMMFYLADKFGVDIVVNEDYYRYNNCSSLMLVREQLGNTYICSSDNYFTENPFEEYVYRGYYATVFADGETDEYCVEKETNGFISEVTVGGKNTWCMLGHVYFDREFSKKFVRILENEFQHAAFKEQLWEEYYYRHLDELKLEARHYSADVIKEFDSLADLREFDEQYLMHTNSKILLNICKILSVTPAEITHIKPIKDGLTNTSFRFECKGESYVYRHPGKGTEEYINRLSEAASMRVAAELGIDQTFVAMDENEGWKISKFIENARLLDYENEEDVDAVVVGLDRQLTYDKLAIAAKAVLNGAELIGTNPDTLLPTANGFVPSNGGQVKYLEYATSTPATFIGKPSKIIMESAMNLFSYSKDEIVMVGDNYDTDIMSGINGGIDTIHVQTGVTSLEDLETKEHKPTYSIKNLFELVK